MSWLRPLPGQGGAKRFVVAVAAAAILVGGCASSPPSKSAMVDALRTSGIPAGQARCAADAIYSSLSDEQIVQLVERGAGGVPKDDPNRTNEPTDRLNKAMSACRDGATTEPISGPREAPAATTTSTAPATTSPSDGPTTSEPSFDTVDDGPTATPTTAP